MSIEVSFHPVAGRKHQEKALGALQKGVLAFGDTVTPNGDVRVTWGLPRYEDGSHKLILEAGYVNGDSGNYVDDRLRFISTGWNGLHGNAREYAGKLPSDRWDRLGIELEDWKTHGDYNLILNQHPGDTCAPQHHQWEWLCDEIRKSFGEIRVRNHPLVEKPARSLREDLAQASRCFTWNSSGGIEAVCRGVPSWSFDRRSMIWSVSRHTNRDFPYVDDRSQWAHRLAYRQWTHTELESGEAWAHLRSYFF